MASPKKFLRFEALIAKQSPKHQVVMIRATAADIQAIAQIERLGREDSGQLVGFQRPQISTHIAEIRRYLSQAEAVLPNALVVAFVGDARLTNVKGSVGVLEVDIGKGKPGLVVDGQQRLTALAQSKREDFEAFVACLVCRDMDELRRQFILINNTRPLPKSLIYELLPTVGMLPERLSSRALAAAVTARLNFDASSSLHRQIKMQTNPEGVIKDTAIQKLIMNSESAGAIQTLSQRSDDVHEPVALVDNFFGAVQEVFPDDWHDHKPTTSRLVHGAGVVAMGYVMDEIYSRHGDHSRKSFVKGLQPLKGRTAWTSGSWKLGPDEQTPWNRIEFTPRQYMQLAEHLVGVLRRPGKTAARARSRA